MEGESHGILLLQIRIVVISGECWSVCATHLSAVCDAGSVPTASCNIERNMSSEHMVLHFMPNIAKFTILSINYFKPPKAYATSTGDLAVRENGYDTRDDVLRIV